MLLQKNSKMNEFQYLFSLSIFCSGVSNLQLKKVYRMSNTESTCNSNSLALLNLNTALALSECGCSVDYK